MFTMSDIGDIAVQIERNGEAAYRRASTIAADPVIARLLEVIADEEKKHAQWFEQFQGVMPVQPKDDQIRKLGRELLQNMVSHQTFSLDEGQLAHTEDMSDLLAQSIEFESDTILFYELLYGFLSDSDIMRHLELILEEERSHIVRLKEMVAELKDANQRGPESVR